MNALLGRKVEQSQRFLLDGTRVPVTIFAVGGNQVVAVKTNEKNGYSAIQIGFGSQKRPTKALLGLTKKANLAIAPEVTREVRFSSDLDLAAGTAIKAEEVFEPGDVIDVTGVSKGKGFAGGVKRHHFKGGPRTHGQSDRERAPGSIGQTTTPGRVYKGKRMAGHMGAVKSTVKNLQVVAVGNNQLIVRGLVPGSLNSVLMIVKKGKVKKFVPLYSEEQEQKQDASVTQEAAPQIPPQEVSQPQQPTEAQPEPQITNKGKETDNATS